MVPSLVFFVYGFRGRGLVPVDMARDSMYFVAIDGPIVVMTTQSVVPNVVPPGFDMCMYFFKSSLLTVPVNPAVNRARKHMDHCI